MKKRAPEGVKPVGAGAAAICSQNVPPTFWNPVTGHGAAERERRRAFPPPPLAAKALAAFFARRSSATCSGSWWGKAHASPFAQPRAETWAAQKVAFERSAWSCLRNSSTSLAGAAGLGAWAPESP